MPDEFFLRYANNLFNDDPKNLKLVIQDFLEQQLSITKASGMHEEMMVFILKS
jgi:hypothetical protein